ncbi:PLDc N-terminal domain-containing protein [Solirubrobacter phytolaccae]|uniref:PLDc N-terminal domain-containing protein n=1 Tax=Solirubrobacter phytolaccae TaxID=1404360 RepID=A0A9X3ND80_9ACTN|nr:PLDc N-terminal domain-containing protein [Solirubrobacter phytolaccae]MDA0184510.1 PLDc N-terminal domain-containing protein [Solirubrobacter phytolaccae]
MLFAADYPLLNIFWSMILFFFWIAWIWVLVGIIGDVFRRDDASGWVKALWVFFLIFIPFAGVLAYLIVNGEGMGKRGLERAQERQAQLAPYLEASGTGGPAHEIEKGKSLLDSGAITEAEFATLKAKALA